MFSIDAAIKKLICDPVAEGANFSSFEIDYCRTIAVSTVHTVLCVVVFGDCNRMMGASHETARSPCEARLYESACVGSFCCTRGHLSPLSFAFNHRLMERLDVLTGIISHQLLSEQSLYV